MRWLLMLTLAAACACGRGKPAASAQAGTVDFDSMSKDQKTALMKRTVAPKMKSEFQAFDAHDFADFTCKTCHGAGASAGTFKMPNPQLPKLDVAHGFAKDKAEHPKAIEFMQQKVLPEMAQMLGQPMRSEAHPDGLGCMDCHTAP